LTFTAYSRNVNCVKAKISVFYVIYIERFSDFLNFEKKIYTVLCCYHYGSIRFVNIYSNRIVVNLNCVIER
jgi:hypothetical protein